MVKKIAGASAENKTFNVQEFLTPTRKEDEGSDLWSVFNLVQEKLVNGMFDMKIVNHLFLGGMLSAFMGLMIFLIASLDNPFRGELSISSAPFQDILTHLMEE